MRYTKGTSERSEKRSWQSLDVVLRSDAAASEALPYRKLRLARLFTALGIVSSVVAVAGIAASAREGLDHLVIGQGKWVSLKERGLGFT